MNPFFLLFALLGMSASSSGGRDDGTGEVVTFSSSLPDEDDDTPEEGETESPPPVVSETPVVLPGEVPEEETPVVPPVEVPEEETPEETPSNPAGSGGSGSENDQPETEPVIIDGTVDVIGGRVATLSPAGDDITDVQITSGVEHGTITVNHDGTFALVMTQSDFVGTQSFSYEATHSDGSVTQHDVSLDVTAGPQESGWATGENTYMLETDADGRVVVEHGDTHHKVFISGSTDALSLAEIAGIEGVSVSDVDGAFLLANGYGTSEGTALDEVAGTELWNHVTPVREESSNWLLYERGYSYDGEGINGIFSVGESELNPVYVGAWGEGDLPELTYEFNLMGPGTANVVVQDIHFTGGLHIYQASNIIADGVEVSGSDNFVAIESDGVTLMNSYVHDVSKTDISYISGAYFGGVTGILVDGNIFDHNGWTEDGSDEIDNMSHNLYIDAGNWDSTVRDNITMQGSAFGAHIRPGGFIEDNVFLDNNAAVDSVGGDFYDFGDIGNYALYSGNVITSAAYLEGAGYKSLGLADTGNLTTLVDNVIAHMADPNNPDEEAVKLWSDVGLLVTDPYYNDTVVWNWDSYSWRYDLDFTDANTEGLDPNVLNQTTIQNFIADALGQDQATIDDLAAYIDAEWAGSLPDGVTADDIIAYFQSGFGVSDDADRTAETTLRFVPNDIGDGVRWDNRLNWDTNDLPGTASGDSVDLGGNHVVFGTNAEIDQLSLSDGALNVYGGRLDVTGGINDGGHLNVEGAGQAWIGGHTGDDLLDIDVSGGRFVNTGDMSNTDLAVTGGQAVLAAGGAEFDVDSGRTLAIFEAAAKVGFDGDDGDMAILDLHEGSTLAYSAQSGDLGTIEEFRSGAMGDEPDVLSGIDLGGATLEIDLEGLSAEVGSEFLLMEADEIAGTLGDTLVGGLDGRDATIVVDYLNDTVTLQLTAGSGAVSVETVGEEADVSSDATALWDALTADQGLAENQAVPAEEEDLLEVA